MTFLLRHTMRPVCALGVAPMLLMGLGISSLPLSAAAVPDPGLAAKAGSLVAASVISPTDGWAVGYRGTRLHSPVAEHWDGSRWNPVSIAKVGSSSAFSGVSAAAANDVWAAGSYRQDGALRTLVEHWDGSTWTPVQTDDPANQVNQLNAVSADSSTDAWAAGYSQTSSGVTRTLVEHFDGSAWHQVTSYDPGDNQTIRTLRSVSAVSPTDVWAVGDFVPSGESQLPLIEHWNGTEWSETPEPNPEGSLATYLYGVDALSATDVWAVGSYQLSGAKDATLIEHWDGTSWSIVASPNGVPGSANVFTGVSVLSATDAWASGTTNTGEVSAFLAHWDGSTWTRVPAHHIPGARDMIPVAVSFDEATDGWTVGAYLDKEDHRLPLLERWNGKSWKVK